MRVYNSKATSLPGTSYIEVVKVARKEHDKIEKLTKRRPYVKSVYFNKQKIFISLFWPHLIQKKLVVRTERLKLYSAAIDLMRNTRCEPITLFTKTDLSTMTHRFYGITKDKVEYCVQVKENKRSGRKDFISVYRQKAP